MKRYCIIKNNGLIIISSMSIYVANRKFFIPNLKGIIGYIFKYYFNDLIAPIFFLAICSIILNWAGYEMKKSKIILLFGLMAGIIWEYAIPLINKNSTTDFFDMICYLIGSMIYCILTKRIRMIL